MVEVICKENGTPNYYSVENLKTDLMTLENRVFEVSITFFYLQIDSITHNQVTADNEHGESYGNVHFEIVLAEQAASNVKKLE